MHRLRFGVFAVVLSSWVSVASAADSLTLPPETPSDIANLYIDIFTRSNIDSATKLNAYTQRVTGTRRETINVDMLQRRSEKDVFAEVVEGIEIGGSAEQQQTNRQAFRRLFAAFSQGIRTNNCRADPVSSIRPNTAQKGLNVIATVTVHCDIASLNLDASKLKSQFSGGAQLVKFVDALTEQLNQTGAKRHIVRDFNFYATRRNLYWHTGAPGELTGWLIRETLAAQDGRSTSRPATLLDVLREADRPQKKVAVRSADAKPSQRESELADAVMADDLAKVKKLLASGANPTPPPETSPVPPLLAAIDAERTEMVKLLLPKSNPNWTTDNGANSLLMYAVVKGDTSMDIVRALLDAGARVDAVNPMMGTPLVIALHNLHNKSVDKTVALLLERGADVNLQGTRFEGEPLIEAARSLSALRLLVASGKLKANSARNARTPIHGVCAKGIYAEADALKEKQEAPERVRLLMSAGFQLDSKDADGATALNAYPSNLPCMMALVDAGADVNAADEEGRTPIARSLLDSTGQLMDKLLAKSARVDVVDAIGSTPLHEAALEKDPQFVRKLLAAGARTDVTDRFGWTPLGLAQAVGYADNIKLLQAAR